MPLTLDGTNGVSAVQTGAVESGDLPAGSVIQVTENSSTTSISGTSEATIISHSITPQSSSSKIFVLYNGTFFMLGNNRVRGDLKLLRDGGEMVRYIETPGIREIAGGTPEMQMITPLTILDSPATTSSVTYSVKASFTSGTFGVGFFSNRYSITLMEIAG